MTASPDNRIQMASPDSFPEFTQPITRVGLGGEGILRSTGKGQDHENQQAEREQQIKQYGCPPVYGGCHQMAQLFQW